MHYIRYDVLYQAVLERLQYWAKAVQQDEEKVLNKIQKVGNAERIREKKKKASALKKAENRQNEIDRLFAKMYEDRACEKITERNFIMLSGKYQKEQIELEQRGIPAKRIIRVSKGGIADYTPVEANRHTKVELFFPKAK